MTGVQTCALPILLLIKGVFDAAGVRTDILTIAWWGAPTALWVLAVGWWRYRALDRRIGVHGGGGK